MQNNVLSNNPAEDIAPVSPFGAIDYGTSEDELKTLAAKFANITQVTTRKEFDAAQAAVTTLVRARSRIENRRKELKSESLEFGRLVDSTAKNLIAVVTPEEQRIDALIEAVKRQKEVEKAERERVEKDRIGAILARIDDIVKVPAAHQRSASALVLAAQSAVVALLIDDTYQEFTQRAQEAKDNAIAELTELHQGALHDERLAEQERLERGRIAIEQKAEAERLANERAELDAIRKHQLAEQAARLEKETQERAEIARQKAELAAEREKVEAEKRAELLRIEQQKKAEEQAAADEKQKEADRIKQERMDKERDAMNELTKPDREKLDVLANVLLELCLPKLANEGIEAGMYRVIQEAVANIRDLARRMTA